MLTKVIDYIPSYSVPIQIDYNSFVKLIIFYDFYGLSLFYVDKNDLFLSVSLVLFYLKLTFPFSSVPGLLADISLLILTLSLRACPFGIPISSSSFWVASFMIKKIPAKI